jgi:cytochrome c oxidase assembly factor CtaG
MRQLLRIRYASGTHVTIVWSRNNEAMHSPDVKRRRWFSGICALLISGCSPVISVAGANFPVWMLCLFAGILVALFLRPVFVATGIDEWMTPRPLIYSCLALAIASVCWLVLWR